MKPAQFIQSCVFLAFLCCGGVKAEVQTQHIFDSSMKIGPIEPLWHVRVRTTPQGGGLAQIRTGPIFNFDVHDRATLIGGYYYTRAKQDAVTAWTTTHRSFGGVEVAAWEHKVEIDVRSMVERFTVISDPDYTRFRNRVRISPSGVTAPYIGVEVFHDAEGLRSIRYSAGIRRTVAEKLILDFGYFFEDGRANIGGNRHMFGTTIHWRDKSKRLDTDP